MTGLICILQINIRLQLKQGLHYPCTVELIGCLHRPSICVSFLGAALRSSERPSVSPGADVSLTHDCHATSASSRRRARPGV